MPYFDSVEEVNKYIGGIFIVAGDHPEVGPKMKAAKINMKVIYEDPECEITVVFDDPMQVIPGENDLEPDVTLMMRADTADKFWRGEYNLAVGLAKGQVKARGPVNKILKLAALTKPLFPMYREAIAEKDNAAATA